MFAPDRPLRVESLPARKFRSRAQPRASPAYRSLLGRGRFRAEHFVVARTLSVSYDQALQGKDFPFLALQLPVSLGSQLRSTFHCLCCAGSYLPFAFGHTSPAHPFSFGLDASLATMLSALVLAPPQEL